MRAVTGTILLFPFLFVLTQCSNDDLEQSQVKFGFYTTRSLLATIKDANGKLPVDIYDLRTFEHDDRKTWNLYTKKALEEWLAPLQDSGRLNMKVEPSIRYLKQSPEVGVTGCEFSHFHQNTWDCNTASSLKIILHSGCNRSHADARGMYIAICDDWNTIKEKTYNVLLHEMGHTFGLVDLYDANRLDVLDTQAILNNPFFIDGLKEDDRIGIITLYDYLFRDGPKCPSEWHIVREGGKEYCLKKSYEIDASIFSGRRITKITIKSGDIVDRITFTFDDQSQLILGESNGGRTQRDFILKSDEYLTSVAISQTNYKGRLALHGIEAKTNKGQKIWGGYPPSLGHETSISIRHTRARSGQYISAFGGQSNVYPIVLNPVFDDIEEEK